MSLFVNETKQYRSLESVVKLQSRRYLCYRFNKDVICSVRVIPFGHFLLNNNDGVKAFAMQENRRLSRRI